MSKQVKVSVYTDGFSTVAAFCEQSDRKTRLAFDAKGLQHLRDVEIDRAGCVWGGGDEVRLMMKSRIEKALETT